MLKENKLIIGNFYRIKFNSRWVSFGNYDITVNSITSLANSAEYSDFDIRGTFFTSINLSLSDYILTVKQDVDIYVCTVIKTKDPIKLESKQILIPKSMINFNNSEEFINVEKLDVNIKGITRSFNNSLEKANYIGGLIKSLKLKLKAIKEFGGVTTSISTQSHDYLILKTEYESFEKSRDEVFERVSSALSVDAQEREKEWEYIYLKRKELMEKITEYNTQIGLANIQLAEATTSNNTVIRSSLIISNIQIVIEQMLTDIRNEIMDPTSIPVFSVLYDQEETKLIDNGTIDPIPEE